MERNDVKLIWHSPRLSSDMESQTKRKSTYETLFNFDNKRHILEELGNRKNRWYLKWAEEVQIFDFPSRDRHKKEDN